MTIETDSERPETTPDTAPPAEDAAQGEQADSDLSVLDAEETVGSTEAGTAASEALVALGRAARCFLIYSPDNDAITHFLESLRDKFRYYLDNHGEMALTIRPWEMVLEGEVVYVNRDRERSLSFRLFRDGVRKVIFDPDVAWEEITRFLGIISIRFTGIRQQEDDIVTLLWKAGFKNIEIEAVEGFVPEDDETEMEAAAFARSGAANAMQAMVMDAPYAFDIPWPEFDKRARVGYAEPDPKALAALSEEDASRSLPGQCVRLVREILDVAADPVEPMELEEAQNMFQEIRDFLLAEGLLSSVLEMVRVIDKARFRRGQEEQKERLLRSFADARALARIVHSIPSGQTEAPPELLELLDRIPGDKLTILLDILERERGVAARRITRQLIVQQGVRRVEYLVTRLNRAEGGVAVDLLQVLADMDMEKAGRVASEVMDHPDLEVKLQSMNILERAPYDKETGLKVAQLLKDRNEEVRARALKLLVRERERWAFLPIASRLEAMAARSIENQEAAAMGEALALIWPRRALAQFQKWVRPKRVLKRVMPGQSALKWAAVAGLAHIPGDASEKLIRVVDKGAGEDLHQHCVQALVKHRHQAAGEDSPRGGSR